MNKPTPTLQPRCDSPDVVPSRSSETPPDNPSDNFPGNRSENLPASGTLVPAVEVSCTETGRHLVVTLSGDIDVATASQVRSDLLPLIHHGRPVVVVDLSGVPFLDSTGLGTLLAVHRRADALDVSLRLAAPPRGPRRALHITGLDRVFDVYPSLDDALCTDRSERPERRGAEPFGATPAETETADA